MTKVIARIFGGLGNQLFCYASARRLALVNNAELVLDNVSGFLYDYDFQRKFQLDHFNIPCRKATSAEQLIPFHRIRRYLKRRRSQYLPLSEREYIMQNGLSFEGGLLTLNLKKSIFLEGYWQSEDYFKDIANTLREDLQINTPREYVNLEMAEKMLSCTSVAVHVRFFDSPNQLSLNNATEYYYSNAIEMMESYAKEAHYFIFSDNLGAARTRIPLDDSRITLVGQNQGDELAYADLWLMTKCKHFIIANSTFSWWGAWLGEESMSLIVSPDPDRFEYGSSWRAKGLIPSRWIKL
jgi:hypothetical protein